LVSETLMKSSLLTRRNLLLAATLPAATRVFAQGAPATMRILVGAPPGGTTDTMARAIAPELGRALGRTVVIDNRPGAGGNLAAEAVARSAPDGSTLLMSFTSHAINATLYPHLPFDPEKDFTPLTMVSSTPAVLVANPSLPANNLRELIALAKAKPGKLNFAIGALGSSVHLAGEAFKMMSGTYIVNIPYKGTTPAIQDVLAGQVEMMFANVGNAQGYIKSGRLKALGVTSPKRLPQFPDVPAIAEVLPGYQSNAWFGLFGPAKMPPELARRISDAARQAIASPEVKKRIESDGATPVGDSPEEFARFVHEEIVRWGKVVKYSGAKAE
jgi:tripartite-type tricarboxylate transporter receptor subunit TctC